MTGSNALQDYEIDLLSKELLNNRTPGIVPAKPEGRRQSALPYLELLVNFLLTLFKLGCEYPLFELGGGVNIDPPL